MKNLYYGSQYIDKKDIQAATNYLIRLFAGKIVENFEKKLQKFYAKYCVAVSRHSSSPPYMIAIGLKKNDVIITTMHLLLRQWQLCILIVGILVILRQISNN